MREISSFVKPVEYAIKIETYHCTPAVPVPRSTSLMVAPPRASDPPSVMKCFNCGVVGHRAAECPKARRRTLLVTDESQVGEEEALHQTLIAMIISVEPDSLFSPLS